MDDFELRHLIEELMYNVAEDCTPCEDGLFCPFYDEKNPCTYCSNGDCVGGMVLYIKELTKKNKETQKKRR